MDVFCIDSVDIDSIECIRDPCLVSTVSTYIAFNAFACFDLCINSVDKQNTILNTQ